MADARKGSAFGQSWRQTWLICASTAFIVFPDLAVADEAVNFFDGLATYDAGDVAETVRVWSHLAEAGDAQAQVGLAGLYLAGNGVTRNSVKAASLYRQAAEQGDSNGQLNLGRLYLKGVGVEKDVVAAYGWLSLAARQGRRWAEEKRHEIEPTLTAQQRIEAAALVGNIESPQ